MDTASLTVVTAGWPGLFTQTSTLIDDATTLVAATTVTATTSGVTTEIPGSNPPALVY